jgi:2',3'-cyclic-nucleotide 2'-phosphodiesterase (5'-nucleotidase family)
MHGGTLYRPAFEDWFSERHPGLAYFWVSTGAVTAHPESKDPMLASPRAMYGHLRKVNYRAIAATHHDVASVGPDLLLRLRQDEGLPLLSSDLLVYETGRRALPSHVVEESSGLSVGFVSSGTHVPASVWGSPSAGTWMTSSDPDLLQEAINAAGRKSDLVVLLADMSTGALRRLLRQIEGVDLVIGSYASYTTSRARKLEGVPVLWIGRYGQYLGRIALGPGGRLLEARVVEVGSSFPIDPVEGRPRVRGGDQDPGTSPAY